MSEQQPIEQQPTVELPPPAVKSVTLLGRGKDLVDDMKKFFKERGLISERKSSDQAKTKADELNGSEQGTQK